MSLDPLPYKVENIQGASPVDITSFVSSIDSVKFQGSGRIRTGNIMFNADEGALITNANVGGTGASPIINQFDKLRVTFTDDFSISKAVILEVDQELGQQSSQGGNLLPIEFKARERALQDIKFTGFFQFKTPKFVLQELRRRYNRSRGVNQPALNFVTSDAIDHVEAPNNIVNIYDFTQEISYYDAMMQVVTRLNQPIGQGGTGNFFAMTVDDQENVDPLGGTALILNVFVQGENVSPVPTILSTPDDPIHSINFEIHSQSATQIFVRGQMNTGYHPNDFHVFISFVEEINNIPVYDAAEIYPTGFRTRGPDDFLYVANVDVPINTAPPAAQWDLTNPDTIIGPLNYSLWTKNKVAVTKNSMANASNDFQVGGFDAPAFPDGNLVIRDGLFSATGEFIFFRDFAFLRASDDDAIQSDPILKHYLFQQVTAGLYNGFRVLVDPSLGFPLGGKFAANGGKDKFGRPFLNSFVIMDDTGEWIVFREPQVGDQCCILTEGRTYEFNVEFTQQRLYGAAHKSSKFRGPPTGTLAWRDVSFTAGGNDVFHHPSSIEKVDGLFLNQIKNDDYSTFITDSAIKITYEFNLNDSIHQFFSKFREFFSGVFDTLVDLSEGVFGDIFEPTDPQLDQTQLSSFYDFGWWYALPFPYPWSTLNGIQEELGDLYGKSTPGATGTVTQFAVLDLQNANFSHSGLTGLNHDEVSDLGGPFTGIHFYQLFNIFLGTLSKPFTGDITFVMTIYDDLSQVWRADYKYRFLGDAQEIYIPFSSFSVERPSRTPWGINTIFSNVVVPEIEIRSIFEEKRVRLITWMLADAYDEHLRYLPVKMDALVESLFGIQTITFEGTIDALTLTKQPFVSSGVEANRVINSDTIELPNTRNIRQLQSVAIAAKDLANLQFEQYGVMNDGRCDLITEQSVFLEDKDMVKFRDRNESSPGANDGDLNTRKLVVMAEDFSFNANGQKSGFLVTRNLTRRLPIVS